MKRLLLSIPLLFSGCFGIREDPTRVDLIRSELPDRYVYSHAPDNTIFMYHDFGKDGTLDAVKISYLRQDRQEVLRDSDERWEKYNKRFEAVKAEYERRQKSLNPPSHKY